MRTLTPTVESDLANEMLALREGEHLCLVYDADPAEQLPAILPFLRRGLERGEQCVYVADDHTLEALRDALQGGGIDVATEAARGALQLWTRAEWRQPGELESSRKEAQVRQAIEAALAAGFSGVRFGVEMTWTLGPDIDATRLAHWEATINRIFTPDIPARIICQYSRKRLAPSVIQAGLHTHPVAVIGTRVCPNPYYRAPLILDGEPTDGAATPEQTDWMISQLQWAWAYEREREQRLKAQAELDALQDLYVTAEATAEELRRDKSSKDEFLAMVSHELRTPIAAVLGNGLLLLRQWDRLDPEDRRQSLTDIVAEGQKLQRIIENLLVLTRMEIGTELETHAFCVREVVEEAVASFGRRRGRSVTLECADEVPPAVGQPQLIAQVMENLLSNADKYSPVASTTRVSIDRAESGDIEVRVSDSGIGINEDEDIFAPFFRSETAASHATGIGLGLAVCKRVIEAHGGSIRARRRLEGGSEFAFTLKPDATNGIGREDQP